MTDMQPAYLYVYRALPAKQSHRHPEVFDLVDGIRSVICQATLVDKKYYGWWKEKCRQNCYMNELVWLSLPDLIQCACKHVSAR